MPPQTNTEILMVHALKAANPKLPLEECRVLAGSIIRFLKSQGYEIVREASVNA